MRGEGGRGGRRAQREPLMGYLMDSLSMAALGACPGVHAWWLQGTRTWEEGPDLWRARGRRRDPAAAGVNVGGHTRVEDLRARAVAACAEAAREQRTHRLAEAGADERAIGVAPHVARRAARREGYGARVGAAVVDVGGFVPQRVV